MKAIPLGPIVRLASLGHSDLPTSFERHDWSAGRYLKEEEVRAGILLSRNLSETPFQALFKAHGTDFQVHQVEDKGLTVHLKAAPKARWKKVSRTKTILLENTPEPFSTPDKSTSPVVQSHGGYIKRRGKLAEAAPLLAFTLFRETYSLEEVLNRLRYEAGIGREAIVLHDTPGGHYGCVSQSGVAIGVTKEQLVHGSRHYNIHPLIFDPREYHPESQFAALSNPPRQYRYTTLLRFVDGDKNKVYSALSRLKENGFINYFGLERFGCGTSPLFDISALHHKQRYDRAVGSYLAAVTEKDPFHFNHFMAYVNSDPSTVTGVLEKWVEFSKGAKINGSVVKVLRQLNDYHRGLSLMKVVSDSIPIHDQSVRSAAEFLWNLTASQRLHAGGDRVRIGDLVTTADGSTHLVESEEESRQFTLFDVVLPVVYPTSTPIVFPKLPFLSEREFEELAKRHSIEFLLGETAATTALPEYRRLLERPFHLEAQLLQDEYSLSTLKSDSFLLQERSDMHISKRLRYPTVHNVSERHLEKMNFVRQHKEGKQSLFISFVLDRDCSPLSALREVFSLDYLHFTDLITA